MCVQREGGSDASVDTEKNKVMDRRGKGEKVGGRKGVVDPHTC